MSQLQFWSRSHILLSGICVVATGLLLSVAAIDLVAATASHNVSATIVTTLPATVCTPRVLWDQLGSVGTNGTASQDFETANDAFDAEAAEDFMVTSGQTWAIQKVVARGIYFNGSGPADSFNVRIGSSPGSGTVYSGLSYTTNGDDFEIPLPSGITLPTGIYWVSVQARMDYTPGGQWAWANRAPLPFLSVAQWRNPGGGYMIPQCANFADRGVTCGIDAAFPEQAFRLEGLIIDGSCSTPTATATPSPINTPTATNTPTMTPSPCGMPGSPDHSFNGSGAVITSIGTANDHASSVTLQTDGRIVAAGSAINNFGDFDFALARYNLDGSPDTSFNGTGTVVTPIHTWEQADAVAIQADGKILAAGNTDNGTNYDFALVRYNPDGTLDTSFGNAGIVTTAIGNNNDFARSIAVQPDGKIVLAGEGFGNSQGYEFQLARYNIDGSLDTSFNGNGKVTTPVIADSGAYSVALQADGKIVAAGYAAQFKFALVRYNPDGTLDTSFNGTGKVLTSVGGFNSDIARSVAIQADGLIVAAGNSWDGSDQHFATVRYNTDGTLDTTFNNGTGKVLTSIGSNNFARSVLLQNDRKIVVTGESYGDGTHFTIIRYNPDGSLDTSFNGSGHVATLLGQRHRGCASTRRQDRCRRKYGK